jgi:hypothetical protein
VIPPFAQVLKHAGQSTLIFGADLGKSFNYALFDLSHNAIGVKSQRTRDIQVIRVSDNRGILRGISATESLASPPY